MTLHSVAFILLLLPSTFFRDADGDRYGDNWVTVEAETAPAGYTSIAGDCNDADVLVNPGAKELCNNRDDNCNCQIDDNAVQSCPQPGSAACQQAACLNGTCGVTFLNPGTQTCGTGACKVSVPVCLNGVPNTCTPNPAAATAEVCDNVDNDCDTVVDEDLRDAAEPNENCASIVTLPPVSLGAEVRQGTFSLSPRQNMPIFQGDYDYFRIPAVEPRLRIDAPPCRGEERYQLFVTLFVPHDATGSYRLCGNSGVCGAPVQCQVISPSSFGSLHLPLTSQCSVSETLSAWVSISPEPNSNAGGCRPYTLSYTFIKQP